MTDQRLPDAYYIAPKEPPPARRPPLLEVGALHWIRVNLFKTPTDSLITLITFAVVGYFLIGFLDWALFNAQWEIVFNNLRALNIGLQFPVEQVWRASLVGCIVVFLAMMSIGVWGRVTRGWVIVLVIIALSMWIVPFLAQFAPHPPVFTYVDGQYNIRQINFIAHSGQTLTFTLDPLTERDDFRLENVSGYVENDNQQANTSFDAYSAASTQIVIVDPPTIDPALYDLSAAVQIWDRDGQVIAQSPFSGTSPESLTFEWTAPASGWYTYTAIRESENAQGIAWLRVDNLEIYRSTRAASGDRIAAYGEQPALNCTGCATQANRTDMRFQGERTLGQWFALQFAPFLLETRTPFFVALLIGTVGYGIGAFSTRRRFGISLPAGLERLFGWSSAILFGLYLVMQIFGMTGADPNTSTPYLLLLGALCVSVILYALTLLIKGGASSARAVTLLWAISFPVILTLVNGVAGDTQLTPIPSDKLGGLLLTLLFSAVAIIASFPIGLVLALGRQSSLPIISLLCTVFIEVVRGVPLITLIFAGRLILPFFGFGLGDVDLLIRIMVVLTLFTSAYLAEVIRGGLQVIPKGQLEAAHALGLNDFWMNTLIVIPQALRYVIPAIMGQAISLFKDTSLVYVIGLFELVGSMNQILGDSQTGYLMFPREGYLYIGILFFVFSYLMAEASRRVEKTGSGAIRRDTI